MRSEFTEVPHTFAGRRKFMTEFTPQMFPNSWDKNGLFFPALPRQNDWCGNEDAGPTLPRRQQQRAAQVGEQDDGLLFEQGGLGAIADAFCGVVGHG